MIRFLIIGLISFLGLVVGIVINKFTKEEIKQGYKYFRILNIILLVLVLMISLYFSLKISWILLILFLVAFLVLIYFKLMYLYLGLVFSLSYYSSDEIVLLITGLIFGYGLVYSAIRIDYFSKEKMKKIFKEFLFYIVPIIVLVVIQIVSLTKIQ